MKKSFALLLCCLFPFMLFAKREAEQVIAIMADGSRLDGYTKTSLINYIKPDISTISISTEPDGEARKFTSDQPEYCAPADGSRSYPTINKKTRYKKRGRLFSTLIMTQPRPRLNQKLSLCPTSTYFFQGVSHASRTLSTLISDPSPYGTHA